MHRAGWLHGLWLIRARLAPVTTSLAALVVAMVGIGVSLTASAEPADLGSISVADTVSDVGVSDVRVTDAGGLTGEQGAAAGSTAKSQPRDTLGGPPSSVVHAARRELITSTSSPQRVSVATVGLDARVDARGVRPDGLMDIPDDGDRVGWYRYGSAPGEGSGSVVLAGHVDTQEGLGVMAALREVPLDAIVKVELADGSVLAYEVVGRETIAKDDLPTGAIFDRAGPERLTLITCGGPWRSAESSYRDNIVVVATPVGQH